MPRPALSTDWRRFQDETGRLQALVLLNNPPAYRKLIGEIAMVRLFLLSENTVASVCTKLLCGASYLDGSTPHLILQATSMAAARELMRRHNRRKPKAYLTWTRSKEIRDNLKNVLRSGDPLFSVIQNHGQAMTEMRYVRNHIVHRNSNTLSKFRNIVRRYYGGLRQGVTPGVLLLTGAFGRQTLMERYLTYYRVMIGDLVRV